MRRYLQPLFCFISGQIIMLVLFLFFPYIGTALATLSEVPGAALQLWGWDWLIPAGRIIIVVVVELVTCYVTARSFMDIRENA